MSAINEVNPFKCLRYEKNIVNDIGLCLSPPYDVISPLMQQYYYDLHECNVIRLILGKEYITDNDSDNRYTRSFKTLTGWIKKGVLTETVEPSFWIYEQTFNDSSNCEKQIKGFIGLVRLQDYNTGAVLPHEKVMKRVVDDRVNLMSATNMQMEYIWSLFEDPSNQIDIVLDGKRSFEQPEISYFENSQKTKHRLWRIKKKKECNMISEVMKGQKIYIADGHHRYQTMLSFRDEMRRKFPDAGPSAPWEFILMFLTNIEQPGLTILPTHRILNKINTLDVQGFEQRLSKFFSLEKYYFTQKDQTDVLKVWIKDLNETEEKHKLGIFSRKLNCYYIVTLNNIIGYEKLISDKGSDVWRNLDVNILNVLILNEILGIDETQLNEGKVIQYTNDIEEGLSEVRKGNAEIAFFPNPTKISEVIKVSDNQELMPRKSTHFYPKPISGLLFYPMNQ